jgi:chloride channel protein, CIC family
MNYRKLNIFERLIDKLHSYVNDKQFLMLSSILVGISAGLAAVVLKSFVHFIRKYFVDGYLNIQDFKFSYIFLPIIGIGLTVFLINRFYNGILSKGLPFILNAIAKKSSFLPFHHMWAHIITSGITVGFGGSVGLESPIVNTGSAIGSNYAKRYKLSYKERTLLLAAGAAGGIAGAFNAPIAGVLFALEVLLIDISLTAFIPLLMASAAGALISKIVLNESILLNFKLIQPFDYHNLIWYILLAVLSGFMSIYYVNTFRFIESRFTKIKSVFSRLIFGGILMSLLLLVFPSLFGEGYESIKNLAYIDLNYIYDNSIFNNVINSKWQILLFLAACLMIKSIAAGITVGAGGNGGNFAPSLFTGAFLGFTFSYFIKLLGYDDIPLVNFTMVAMAGTLSGIFHAPLTAIFLIAEITGGYELMIPLMIVSSISYVIVKYFHPDSMEIAKLKSSGTIVSEDKDTSILGKIEIMKLIETDFAIIKPDDKLGAIVEKIKQSPRNIFPVINKENKLVGIITMISIKEEMFNTSLYNKIIAKELMQKPETSIQHNENILSIMDKFDKTGQWNLPVIENGTYIGFLSKSSILSEYREKILHSV